MSKSYKISSTGFGWLGNAFPDRNSISPFSIFADQASGFNQETIQELVSQSVISPDGTISPEVLPALRLLSEAEGYTRIRILGTNAPVDKITYFNQGVSCSVDSEGNDFKVTYPSLAKEAGYVMEEFTGTSRYVNAHFGENLSEDTSVMFFALVDLIRANSLCTLGGKPGDILFTLEEILQKASGSQGFLWLVYILGSLKVDLKLTKQRAEVALTELESKNLVINKHGRYSLQQKALEMANNMLIPEYIFHITSARMLSRTEAEQSECYVIFCGMHNLLYIDRTGAEVTVETISGSDLFMILSGALTAPLIK